MEGKVSKIVADKGFGFIRANQDGKEYFFHRSDIEGFFDDLVMDFDGGRNIIVTFDVVLSPKGPRAGNVVRIDGGI